MVVEKELVRTRPRAPRGSMDEGKFSQGVELHVRYLETGVVTGGFPSYRLKLEYAFQ